MTLFALKQDMIDNCLPRIANYSFILDIDGHELKVIYKFTPFAKLDNPCYLKLSDLGEDYHFVHFEIRGKNASPTSFHSHWVPFSQIDDVIAYAFELAN